MLNAALGEQPFQGGAEVVVLLLQALEPERLLLGEELRLGLLRELQKVSGMALSKRLLLTRLGSALEPELADRLQHEEARLPGRSLRDPARVGGLAAKQAVVNEGGEQVQCGSMGVWAYGRGSSGSFT